MKKNTAVLSLKKIDGFSLIEALITVVVLSITALASAGLIADMARQSAQLRQSTGRSVFEQELVALFKSTDLCSCNLGNASPLSIPAVGTVEVLALKKSCTGATNDFYEYNAVTGFPVDKNLNVRNITIGNPQLIAGNSYSAELKIDYDGTNQALRTGKYLFMFEKTAAAGPPFVIATCNVAGALSGASAGWRLGGNSGINPELDFFGTGDDTDILIKRNNARAAALRTNQTSFGVGAMAASTGNGNTALGTTALAATTTGTFNTGVGRRALEGNTTGNFNVAVGADVLSAIATGQQNTAIGAGAGAALTGGSSNVAVGRLALGASASGSDNIAIGRSAMGNSTVAGRTVAIGSSALSSVTSGSFNTAVGFEAMRYNTTGSRSTALGYLALTNNTTGAQNVAIGEGALMDNLTGNDNVAIGSSALIQNNAFNNTSIGSSTMVANTTGAGNVAVGWQALAANTTGTGNIGLGARSGGASGTGQEAGNYNIYIGLDSGPINNTPIDNAIAIGRNAIVGASNSMALGGTGPFAVNVGIGITSPQTTLQVAGVISPATNNTYSLGSAAYRFTEVHATNGVINTSDRREKIDIYDSDLGLDFITKLRPVSYRWSTGVDNDVHYGLIAQEAEQVISEVGKTEKTSIVTHDETTDRYGVRYSELISPLIKAVQELFNKLMDVVAHQSAQDREIAELKAKAQKAEQENAAKSKEIAELKARLDRIEKALKSK